jgi:hypothetical protein
VVRKEVRDTGESASGMKDDVFVIVLLQELLGV